MNIRFSPRQRRDPGVCADLFFAPALIQRVQIAEITHRNAKIGDVQGDMEKFGPLKVVLGAIPAAYANHEVRQQPLIRIFR